MALQTLEELNREFIFPANNSVGIPKPISQAGEPIQKPILQVSGQMRKYLSQTSGHMRKFISQTSEHMRRFITQTSRHIQKFIAQISDRIQKRIIQTTGVASKDIITPISTVTEYPKKVNCLRAAELLIPDAAPVQAAEPLPTEKSRPKKSLLATKPRRIFITRQMLKPLRAVTLVPAAEPLHAVKPVQSEAPAILEFIRLKETRLQAQQNRRRSVKK